MQYAFKIKRLLPIVAFVILLTSLSSCKEEHILYSPPVASFQFTPESGATTTVFDFDASHSQDTSREPSALFFRWDWNGDSVWDTGFSKATDYKHRFFAAGDYTVKLEVRNEAGLSDTTMAAFSVKQGYSKPHPSFTIDPPLGNIRTEFHFDGSATRDDEDSLNTLKFRWDFENDGQFDTEFLSDPKITHIFPAAANFHTVMEVLDPSGLSDYIRHKVIVTLYSPDLVATFSWTPVHGTTADKFLFDASASHDPDDPDNPLKYRWDFDSDGTFETDYLDIPFVEHQFKEEGEYTVTLEIQDQYGLINNIKQDLLVAHANMPPTAGFFTADAYGNLTTDFYFNATPTTDPEDWAYQISVRWDFDGDGTWDTDFTADREAYHFYGVEGDYRVRMEAKDSGGLTDTTFLDVHVSGGTNQTGLIINQRDGQYYGTVKIGNQWWMAENLNEPGGFCYGNRSNYCDSYGSLYKWQTAMNGSTKEKARGLCPEGWHIPTVKEWEELINYFGNVEARKELSVEGSSDFRMLFAGQRNPNGHYEFLDFAVNFWSSTKSAGTNAWTFSFQTGKDTYWKLTLGQAYGNSVRCIKD
ncbi:MAG: PKD domain-containing protein [Bacteroidales bacterium]|nr:PKD domain-containing protein [Bacteroidales bacterium]